METIIKSPALHAHSTTKLQSSDSAFWKNMEFNRFGIIAMLVLIIGCAGGVAAAFGAHNSTPELALVAFPTIISLAFILAVAPMKWIMYACSLALALDLFVLIF